MKYLVTGATGLLGNNIVRQLVAADEEVRVLARASSDGRPLAGLPVERVTGDVRNAGDVAEACRGVEAVIHSAAHVHLGWTQLEQHRQINVEGTKTWPPRQKRWEREWYMCPQSTHWGWGDSISRQMRRRRYRELLSVRTS